ncbi:hypothetical protein KFJ24_14680 [Marinobacter sediminum]|uniref:hypothetical protein n=1 Tax=Marinobacter sediminum TaxID=256323 RepID=UPI00202E5E80|nr:hypothetical protein [Marinobacter sediminum]MCM0613728.1 hypothetical protein [Marinobacter sediminum]
MHDLGLRQGCYFPASTIDEESRKYWITSRPDEKRREWKKNNRITDKDILVVISQDCDIACGNDNTDPLVELAVCTPIKAPHSGSTFAYSARKIHFEIEEGCWFEAKVSNLVHVAKDVLWEIISQADIRELPDLTKRTLPHWRALRYRRTALPDAFNAIFNDLSGEFTQQLDQIGQNFVRAVYVRLNSYHEETSYEFELFALLEADTPNEKVAAAIDVVEGFIYQLEDAGIGSAIDNGDVLFAARADQITVQHLLSFVRINFDNISLESGDDDVEVETGA